jgi:hypothetical protein
MSSVVAAEQLQAEESEQAVSIKKMNAPPQNTSGSQSGSQVKEWEWEKVEKDLHRLESEIEEASRVIQQAIRECERKNQGGNCSPKTRDGKEFSLQLEEYKKRLGECIADKEGCEPVVAGFSDLGAKLNFEIQEASDEYERTRKTVTQAMGKSSSTANNLVQNLK